MLILMLLALLFSAAAPADYLAVVPDAYAPALEPLLQRRRNQGLDVRVLSLDTLERSLGRAPLAEDLKEAAARELGNGEGALKYILLVGDAVEGGLPTFHLEHYRWMEQDDEVLASDVPYGDLAGDFLPEAAVGRLPVRSKEQLAQVVQKIIRHETAPLNPAHRLKVTLLGGASGYAPAVDRFIETFSRRMLDSFLPARYELNVIYGSLKSPYCPPPDRIGDAFADRLNEGPAFSVFMGHGSRRICHGMYWQRKQSITACRFGPDHLQKLESNVTSGPLFFFSCDNGFFDGEEPCIAEEVLLHPGGPVCAVASSRFSHPLPNLYSSQALLESLDGCATIGELMRKVQAEGFRKSNPLANMLLKDAEGSLEEKIDVDRLKRDQVWVYNLLGDPATVIRPPRPLAVEAGLAADGAGIELEVNSPFEDGRGYAALYRARTWEPPARALPDAEAAEGEWRSAKEALYREVNSKTVLRIDLEGATGTIKKRLPLEKGLSPGSYRLVVYLESGNQDAAGAAKLEVLKK